ncbi:MAG: GntR family transcriptional regulator [Terrimesophilobacter sp.]
MSAQQPADAQDRTLPTDRVQRGDRSAFATSTVVQKVFDEILTAVHEGRLLPGQRISDVELAAELGVSRTPVREALLRLRQIGIVEASANRFTQVADVSPRETANAMIVWLALYLPLVLEVVPTVPVSTFEAMRNDHLAFQSYVAALDMQNVATSTFSFFNHLAVLSHNPTLRKALTSVVHIVRLGSLHLPDYLDFAALDRSQQLLLDAVVAQDAQAAADAIALLATIEVPQPAPVALSTAPDAG